jgi:hypothetical protein
MLRFMEKKIIHSTHYLPEKNKRQKTRFYRHLLLILKKKQIS